jgi:hypothetical protein
MDPPSTCQESRDDGIYDISGMIFGSPLKHPIKILGM